MALVTDVHDSDDATKDPIDFIVCTTMVDYRFGFSHVRRDHLISPFTPNHAEFLLNIISLD